MASIAYVLCSLLSIFSNFESCFLHYKKQQLVNNNNNNDNHKALFVFGDSVFDAGNGIFVSEEAECAAYWPYGETFFHRTTGRFSDGRIVPDFFARFAGLRYPTPYLQPGRQVFTHGTSFACSAATTLPTNSSDTIDFPTQVMYFKNVTELLKVEVGEAKAKRILADAVYLVSIGGNDYYDFYSNYPNANEESMRAYVKLVTGQLHKYLQEMTRVGAKKIAYLNVAPMGCSPIQRSGDGQCNGKENFLARENNKAMIKVMKEIEREVDGFKYSIFDYYTALLDRIDNPHKYGFKEGEVACCGTGAFRSKIDSCGGYGVNPFELCKNPFEYVFWDSAHLTEGANIQLSRLFWEGRDNMTYPYNAQQLFQL